MFGYRYEDDEDGIKDFEEIFGDMSIEELLCRLPKDCAEKALIKKINTCEDLQVFFNFFNVGKHFVYDIKKLHDLRSRINEVINNNLEKLYEMSDIHNSLVQWVNDENKNAILSNSSISIQLLYNLSDKNDFEAMKNVIHKSNNETKYIVSVLNGAKKECFEKLLEYLYDSDNDLWKVCVLGIRSDNWKYVGDNQKIESIKSFGRCHKKDASFSGTNYTRILPFDLILKCGHSGLVFLIKYLEFRKSFKTPLNMTFEGKVEEDEFIKKINEKKNEKNKKIIEDILNKYSLLKEE